jgi:hypothetical protein
MSLLCVTAVFVSAANALPTGGIYAGWGPEPIPFFFVVDGRTLSGSIECAVYNNYQGNAQLAGTYVYAYQIFSSGSNVSIDSFSVAIFENADVLSITYDDPEQTGGVNPSFAYFSPDQPTAQSAAYVFLPWSPFPGVIPNGGKSTVLLFSSNNVPNRGFGIIEGGSAAGVVNNLPTPVPEPATIVLLGISSAAVCTMRKRRG